MRCYVSLLCVFSVLLAVSLAAPFGAAPANGDASLQIIDNVIQQVTSQLFRIVGRQILQGGGLGGSGSGGGGSGSVSVVLPTFPPDDDDEDYDDLDDATATNSTGKAEEAGSSTGVESTKNSNSSAPFISSVNEENEVAKRHVRRIREAAETEEEEEEAEEDQEAAASGDNGPQPGADLAEAEDTDRNKRFLPDGHGGGGSGNFLFDIIRGTADNAARAVGTVYRMVAGTENLGFGVTATSTKTVVPQPQVAGRAPAKLVAGSGATEEVDEKEHAGGVAEIDVAKAEGYHEGIPGPITRLFVIANRGIANLVQDLILRLAQTSERIVNFKARLITSLI